MNAKLKEMPSFSSDEEAEAFVDNADLTQYDLSSFKPMRFEIVKKDVALNMRLPAPLLETIKARAAKKGIPYSRYIRAVLEEDIARPLV